MAITSLIALACARAQSGRDSLRSEVSKRDHFRVVDILVYTNMPELGQLGMLPGSGSGDFWQNGVASDSLDEMAFRRTIRRFKEFSGLFYIDIETWPVCNAPNSIVARSVANFSRAIDIAREEAPHLVFGIYSIMPAPGYWPIVGNDTVSLNAWRSCNRQVATLAKKVDVIFPSLYTFYDDEPAWDRYAKAVLDAARQYNKPVYPFLWPEYHDSNPTLGSHAIPGRVWRHQLEFVRRNADGVVLWNGLRRRWDDRAEWWLQTREFLEELRNRS